MDFAQAIVEATTDVFNTMVMLEADPGPPATEKTTAFSDSISGILGFSGDIKGMLRINCPNQVAMAITGSLLGMEVEEIDNDVRDAIGEIANMIAGGLKIYFSRHGHNIELSIPTAIGGRAYTVHSLANAEWVAVPFALAAGVMLVEIQFVGLK
jgi:chemotaxis protein CheX